MLGQRTVLAGKPDMEAIGDVVHAFLAADRDDAERLARATRLLGAHGVDGCVDARSLVAIAGRLWRWVGEQFPGAAIHWEWPVTYRKATGTTVVGTVDLVIAADDGLVMVDHNTFPGPSEDAADRALGYFGQLTVYAAAIEASTEKRVLSTWHFPIRGQLVEVRLSDQGGMVKRDQVHGGVA